MVNQNDFYCIRISPEAFITANYLAKIRNPYEFQRNGHLYSYDEPTYQMQTILQALMPTYPPAELSKGNTAIGILSEMLIFDDLTKYLQHRYFEIRQKPFQNQIPYTLTLQQFMIEQSCCYHLVIGSYDNGCDIRKNDISIDIKCYGNKIIENIDEITNLNLLVDKRQFDNFKANIYIQTFILNNNNGLFLVVAGYAESDKLALNSNFPNPAYCCSVSNLSSYELLKNSIF